MAQPPRRPQNVSVALPASLTLDVPHLREKTARLGFTARALATFRVEQAILYRDRTGPEIDREAGLIERILRYIETPQYLRRRIFKMNPDLQFAGTIPPLRTPNHPDREEPIKGQLRDGLVIHSGRSSMIEAGLPSLVQVTSRLPVSQRVTIRLTRVSPQMEGEIVEPSGLTIYWGFRVAQGHTTLEELVRSKKFDLKISTSRRGTDIREVTDEVSEKWRTAKNLLIAFGPPSEGIPEILAKSGLKVADVMDLNLNTIPNQGVETVRTEEALWSSLAILNFLEGD